MTGFVYAYAGYPAWFEGGPVTPEQIQAKKAKPIFTGDFRPGSRPSCAGSKEFGPPGIATHTWVDMMNLYGAGRPSCSCPPRSTASPRLGGTENEDVKNHTAFAPSPVGPSGKPIQSFWTFSVGVSTFSENKADAYKVLAFLTGQQAMQGFAESIGWPYSTFPDITQGRGSQGKWPPEMLDQIEAKLPAGRPALLPLHPGAERVHGAHRHRGFRRDCRDEDDDDALNELQAWAEERMQRRATTTDSSRTAFARRHWPARGIPEGYGTDDAELALLVCRCRWWWRWPPWCFSRPSISSG